MTKTIVTFETENTDLFDQLKMNGDVSALGSLLAAVLLDGESTLTQDLVLAMYGIKVVDAAKNAEEKHASENA
jgi:hypothetical protein